MLRTSVPGEAHCQPGGRLVLQLLRRSGAGLERLQHRPRYPPDPPLDRGAGPRTDVPADAVLLRHLPRGAGAFAAALSRRRQGRARGGAHEPGCPGAALLLGAEEVYDEENSRAPSVHSFATLLADLGTICANQIAPTDVEVEGFALVTTPTPVQRRVFDLLVVSHLSATPSQDVPLRTLKFPGQRGEGYPYKGNFGLG